MTVPPMTSETIEMYLKSICELEIGQSPVAISHLAQRLGVSSPSTLEMVKRLAEQELVTHIPYKGVELTEKGRNRAHNIMPLPSFYNTPQPVLTVIRFPILREKSSNKLQPLSVS